LTPAASFQPPPQPQKDQERHDLPLSQKPRIVPSVE
jgi:hypothetical protein